MERIKNILQRLQEVYFSKHQKSAIDVDLMMDYTRVMYADLMEWRTQFKEPPTTELAEKNTDVATSEAEKQAAQEETPATEESSTASTQAEGAQPEPTVEKEVVANTTQNALQSTVLEEAAAPEKQSDIAGKETIAAQPTTVQNESAFVPIERDEPPAKDPEPESEPVVTTQPDQEKVEVLMTDASGISFEPPARQEVKSEVKEEVLVEEAPTVNQPVEEMPAPAPIEIPLPDMEPVRKAEPAKTLDLFQAAKVANKDIRSSIGINDKYLFLNELFNNHKSNYEETLDKLNHFSTVEQAEDWIRTKVVPAQKWDNDDATVQSFYAMLTKHFSAR
jgi:hypothetical protein